MASEESKTELRQTGIKVQLVGRDGNAFCILGTVKQALRRGGESQEFIEAFVKEATRGDYIHLLATCMKCAKSGRKSERPLPTGGGSGRRKYDGRIPDEEKMRPVRREP